MPDRLAVCIVAEAREPSGTAQHAYRDTGRLAPFRYTLWEYL